MTFAEREEWKLRILKDIDTGTWSFAAGGTLMRATKPSEGGRKDGKAKWLVDIGNCSPLGSILNKAQGRHD